MRRILGYLPEIVRKPVVKCLHNNRALILKAGFGTRLTSPSKFKKILMTWIKEASVSSDMVLIINIAPTNQKIEDHSPGFSRSIEQYNKLIEEVVSLSGSNRIKLVDINRAIKVKSSDLNELINANDGHHITFTGHLLYAEIVAKMVVDFFREEN